MVDIFHNQIISNELKKRVIVSGEHESYTDDILIFATVENEDKLHQNCAYLNCADY